jgi:tRNA pseudouridine38-40 synthase
MTRNIALVLEYDGTRFSGFQRQVDVLTVQGELERAIKALTGREARTRGAGRTDAGVHATGQVVAFQTESTLAVEQFHHGLDYYLPEDIAVVGAYEALEAFDPRRHATSRVYRYTMVVLRGKSPLRRGHVHIIGQWPEISAMAKALGYLEGTRDFAPFSGDPGEGKSTVRRMDRTAVWCEGDTVYIEVEGNAFLPQQVRRMAAAVLNVGLGKLTQADFEALAGSEKRGAAHWVLPPQGLCLRNVKYEDFSSEGSC